MNAFTKLDSEIMPILEAGGDSITVDWLVSTARVFREAGEMWQTAFFLFLYEVERLHMDTLRAGGIDTFELFLKKNNLCSSARYRSFVRGLKTLKRKVVVRVGAEATIAASQMTSKDFVKPYVEAVESWIDDKGGVRPSGQTAATLLRQVDPRAEVPKAVKRQSELRRLREEVKKLKAQLKQEQARRQAAETRLQKCLKGELD